MDILTFISKLIDALAWPMAVVALFVLLMRNLDAIKRSVQTLKVKDVEVTFREKLEEIRETAQDQGVTVLYPAERFDPALILMARTQPYEFVFRIGTEVEELLVNWSRDELGDGGTRNPAEIATQMHARGIIDTRLYDIVNSLLALRKDAVHEANLTITESEGLLFAGLATSIKSRLQQRLAPPPPPLP